jgi:hypothetical protein
MEIICQRTSPAGQPRTRGLITIKDAILSLEDTVRKPGEVKIPGQTALPAGRYRVTLENSPRFGPDTLTLTGFVNGSLSKVPGTTATHTGVRVHGGNLVTDTDGCPLVGLEYTTEGIANCAPAVDFLEASAKAAIKRREEVWWEIKDAFD